MPSGYGKTYQLIKKSAETGDFIICHSFNECSRINSIAIHYKFNIPFPISYTEFKEHKYYGRNIKGFLIDNIELFAQSFTNIPINTIALTP